MTSLGVLLAEPLPSPAYSSECGPLQAAIAQSQPASPCAPATPAPSHDGSFRGSAFSSTTSSSNSATVQPVPRPYSPTVANATRQPMPRPCSPTVASPVQPVPSAAAYQPPAPGAAVAALPHASTFRRPSPAPCTAAPPAPCPYPAAAVQQAAAYPQPASPPACAPVAAPELCPAPAVPCGVYSYPDGSSCATVLPLAPIAPPLAPWTASHGAVTAPAASTPATTGFDGIQQPFPCGLHQRPGTWGAGAPAVVQARQLTKGQTFANVYKKELGKTLKSLDAKKLGKAAKKSGKAAAALTAAGPCGCILLGVAAAGLALFVPLKALARTLKIVNGGEEAQYSAQLAAGAGVREGLDGEQGQQQYETYSRAVPQPAAASGSQGYAQLPMQYQQYPQQQLYQQQYQPISPGMPVMQTA